MSESTPMRTAFVTGAYGMLGSLGRRGRCWTAAARSSCSSATRSPRPRWPSRASSARCAVVRGDLTDRALVERALGEYEGDTVFHLAAQTIVGTANRSPVSTFEANIRGTWTLLEACRTQNVARPSWRPPTRPTGRHETLPYNEDFALQPRFPYDVSKACTDLIARSYFHTYGLPVAVTRFANIYGGGDLNPSRLIPELVAAVLAGRAPVIRSDGSPSATSSTRGRRRRVPGDRRRARRHGARGEAFNAGGDAPHSVREIVELLIEVTGRT